MHRMLIFWPGVSRLPQRHALFVHLGRPCSGLPIPLSYACHGRLHTPFHTARAIEDNRVAAGRLPHSVPRTQLVLVCTSKAVMHRPPSYRSHLPHQVLPTTPAPYHPRLPSYRSPLRVVVLPYRRLFRHFIKIWPPSRVEHQKSEI